MDLLLWIVLGFLAGWIASTVMSGGGEGTLADIVLGVLGALVGGFIMNLFGFAGVNGFNLYSIFVAVIGAIALIWVGRAMREATV